MMMNRKESDNMISLQYVTWGGGSLFGLTPLMMEGGRG